MRACRPRRARAEDPHLADSQPHVRHPVVALHSPLRPPRARLTAGRCELRGACAAIEHRHGDGRYSRSPREFSKSAYFTPERSDDPRPAPSGSGCEEGRVVSPAPRRRARALAAGAAGSSVWPAAVTPRAVLRSTSPQRHGGASREHPRPACRREPCNHDRMPPPPRPATPTAVIPSRRPYLARSAHHPPTASSATNSSDRAVTPRARRRRRRIMAAAGPQCAAASPSTSASSRRGPPSLRPPPTTAAATPSGEHLPHGADVEIPGRGRRRPRRAVPRLAARLARCLAISLSPTLPT
jgi:hypothetical protein